MEKIKEYEIGEHCFGLILTVDGINYDDLPEEKINNLIQYMLNEDVNKASFKQKVFIEALEYLQAELVESDSSVCDQCGNYNSYNKFKIID